ncbi:MAG: hypothetical protein U9R57_13445, partial [Thermodesulfobacteriota bacterium]|nr:hypothetical protein [Thermodesulfobacteriota bacterium]
QQTDQKLIEQVKLSGRFSDSITRSLDQLELLQKEIVLLLQETLPRANSLKSLMASEIHSIKNGRKALNGYKIQEYHQGRIVNSAL